jgi:hypothetical protein
MLSLLSRQRSAISNQEKPPFHQQRAVSEIAFPHLHFVSLKLKADG